jgi:hypothetical protein
MVLKHVQEISTQEYARILFKGSQPRRNEGCYSRIIKAGQSKDLIQGLEMQEIARILFKDY